MYESSFISNSSEIHNLTNEQSNVSESEKNSSINFEDENIQDLSESFKTIQCDLNCKIKEFKFYYLFTNCITQYSCDNNHSGMCKFIDYYNKIKHFNFNDLNFLIEKEDLEKFIKNKFLKEKFEEFKIFREKSNKILIDIQNYKIKLDEIYENELKYINNIKEEYSKKYENYCSLIKAQIKLCEDQFYYFQNLINNNNFNKEEFEYLNLFNFKNFDEKLIPFDKNIKTFKCDHILREFLSFCKDSNSFLKKNKIKNNNYEPNDYEKKMYEIFSKIKPENIQNINKKNVTEIIKNYKYNYKYFVYFNFKNFGFLKFVKENKIYICNHKNNNNKNDDLIEFYNENDKFYGKWMNFINENNNNYIDIFESSNSFIGTWKKLNFNGEIINCFFGTKVVYELKENITFNIKDSGDIEKEILLDFFENHKEKIIKFKKKIAEKMQKFFKKKVIKKKSSKGNKHIINNKTNDMKFIIKEREFYFLHIKNGFVEGELKNNNFNGYIEIHYKNGDVFKGEMKNGKKNGFGIFYKTFYQIWENDKKIWEK